MKCEKSDCGGKTKVTRTEKWKNIVIRFRTCLKCGHKMKTTESADA